MLVDGVEAVVIFVGDVIGGGVRFSGILRKNKFKLSKVPIIPSQILEVRAASTRRVDVYSGIKQSKIGQQRKGPR